MAISQLLEKALRLQQSGKQEKAARLYAQALGRVKTDPVLWFNHGLMLRGLGAPEEALASFGQALELAPGFAAEIWNERGVALMDLGRPDEALESFDKAIAARAGFFGAFLNRGRALAELKRPEEALASYETALGIHPQFSPALNNRGLVLTELRKYREALASYDVALAMNPDDAEALNNRGLLFAAQGRFAAALADYDRALTVNPGLAATRFNRAHALLDLKQTTMAHAEFKAVLLQHPSYPYALDGAAATTLRTCDWVTRAALEQKLPAHVMAGRPLIPFKLLNLSDDAGLQHRCAADYARMQVAANEQAFPRRPGGGRPRLKIAYLSADFRHHPVAAAIVSVLERHDRRRFEIFAVSLAPDDNSLARRRIQNSSEHFADVSGNSDREIALALQGAGIDILVDLNGHSEGARPAILGWRPAPVQAHFLGYPGTMGAAYIDYMLADEVVLPPGAQAHCTEQVVRLPHCYLPSDAGRVIAADAPSRLQAGLPESGFVFCCFNSCWKIAPHLFDIWMRLLHAVPDGVLWLRFDNDEAARNLRREAAARGIDPDRLVFAPRMEEAAHLARHRLADLFLDTLPYSGHSTAIDALYAGLPLVSCLGASFAGRVSASALRAACLPELVAASLADYEALALRLARDRALLAQLRHRLEANRRTAPLFDMTGFCGALEAAYEQMWAIYSAGRAPQAFSVPPCGEPEKKGADHEARRTAIQ